MSKRKEERVKEITGHTEESDGESQTHPSQWTETQNTGPLKRQRRLLWNWKYYNLEL